MEPLMKRVSEQIADKVEYTIATAQGTKAVGSDEKKDGKAEKGVVHILSDCATYKYCT
jgi:hypothetical protein